ncbi:MAG TPA: ABC transporter ATP-binding protein, partial [Acidimicrobiales bacterium]|nr:ABC transporter ATP-binding protein [Acidimicrobiales bacterium]
MAELVLDGITVPLRSFDLALSLEVGATTALVGPSGAGKSTVLRAVAGLVRPAAGRITCNGDTWFDAAAGVFAPPDRRRVGLVFQDYALFPHMTVRQNVEYARQHAADAYLDRFRIRHLEHARPGELSGGERQRVALARALARDPAVLLLDEPLSALDAHTRVAVRAELQELLRDLGLPVLLVSHDFDDAAALTDRVGVIIEGRLRQTGTPAELVARPADPFVASFTGANLLHGEATRAGALTRVTLADGTRIATVEDGAGPVVVAVYPWDVTISAVRPDDSAMNVVAGPIGSLVELGNRVRVAIGPVSADVTADSVARLGLRVGQIAFASFKATGTRLVATSPRGA